MGQFLLFSIFSVITVNIAYSETSQTSKSKLIAKNSKRFKCVIFII